MASPTARTLEQLRKLGWTPDVVERHNTFSHKKHDLWGFGDVIACRPGCGNLIVQATSESNHAARRTKLLLEPRVITYLSASKDNHVEIWSWRKRALIRKDGSKSKAVRWEVRREAVTGVQVVNEQGAT